VVKKTGKKSKTKYLTQNDIKNLLGNIKQYENKTYTVYVNASAELQKEKENLKKNEIKIIKMIIQLYGTQDGSKLLNLVKKRFDKNNELKEKRQEAKEKIRAINKEIMKIKKDAESFEASTKAETEKLERLIFPIIKDLLKLKNVNTDDGIRREEFINFLNVLTRAVKTNEQRKSANKRQTGYRKRKKEKEGKTLLDKGRPRKNKQ
jgi:hypothetical protein